MPLILSGSVDISGSMTATTILVSSPGGGGMVSSSAQITELAPLMAYTASLKGAAIVSSSQQIQNYFTFARTGSANTFYGNQIISGALGVNGSANEPIVINSTNATTLNTSYRYNNGTQLGYIGTGQGLVTGGGSTIFAIRSENSMAFSVNGGTIAQTITSAGQTQITGSFEVNGTVKTRSTNTFNGGTTYLGTTTFFSTGVSGPQNYGGSTIRIVGGQGTDAAGIQFGAVDSNATGARGRIGFLASANNGNPKEFAIIKGVLDSTGANTCDGSLRFHTLNGDNASEASLRMTIDGSGNIGATSGTNIYNASDIRLKQNISSISGSLNSVLLLNPVKFNWIDNFVPFENGKDMLGFIAQEVQTIVPEAVESFAADSIFVGETEIDNPLRVNEKFLIPVLTKAIQEQQAIIDGLIARIEALENN
jgi:hypothetical protein